MASDFRCVDTSRRFTARKERPHSVTCYAGEPIKWCTAHAVIKVQQPVKKPRAVAVVVARAWRIAFDRKKTLFSIGAGHVEAEVHMDDEVFPQEGDCQRHRMNGHRAQKTFALGIYVVGRPPLIMLTHEAQNKIMSD